MSKEEGRQANLRAIQRMLAYAMAETLRQGLPEVAEMIATAQLMIGDALSPGAAQPEPGAMRAEPPKIRLMSTPDARYAEGKRSEGPSPFDQEPPTPFSGSTKAGPGAA